jgi:hypothetical protein
VGVDVGSMATTRHSLSAGDAPLGTRRKRIFSGQPGQQPQYARARTRTHEAVRVCVLELLTRSKNLGTRSAGDAVRWIHGRCFYSDINSKY